MTTGRTKSPVSRIRVSVVSNHQLVRECLSCLIQNNKDLKVVRSYGFVADKGFKSDDSDIFVIYLESGDPVKIIENVIASNPNARVVAVTDGKDIDCSTQALKLGAVGIVRSDQSSKLLVEAIRRAFKGETWLNQTMLTNLLKNGDASSIKNSNGKLGPAPETITPREVEVIAMIGKGLKSKAIAERMFISEATVRHHLSSIYGKLGVDDRLNLVIYAFEHGLIPLNDSSRDEE
ncbi:MAG: DNA-binding response regulator [Pyrinomonadaceae bacterium]